WLVDNGSTDETREVFAAFAARAEERGWSVQQILNEVNVGAVTGRNQALAQATGEYIAFLDNDTAVRDTRWAAKLRAVLMADPTIGLVGPKLVFPWPPYLIECAGCAISPGGRVQYRGRGEPRDRLEFNRRQEVQGLISACWLFRCSLYQELGPLDEIFNPVQYEDLDYCYRAKQLGYRCVYVPEVEMYHFENVTTAGSGDINFAYRTLRNGRIFARRWQQVFAQENGPPDEAVHWRDLPRWGVEEVGELPTY
ncbi:MAG TPA: glycosyltransferase family 2 protein, partial [Armatimonadetes bacterium]|nr:glycosyltransferase family 2 protein [Armatimonadota bacterium]